MASPNETVLKNREVFLHILYIIGAIFLLVIAGTTYLNFQSHLENEKWVNHTNQVLYAAEKEISLLKDAETGERGYVITGDSTYLEPYLNSIDSIDRYLDQLDSLTRDNASQQSRLEALRKAVDQKMTILREIIQLKSNNQQARLKRIFSHRIGEDRMDEVRRILHAVMEEENRLLDIRNRKHRASIDRTRLSIYFIIAASLLIDALLVLTLRRELRQKAAYQRTVAEKNRQLAHTNEELSATVEDLGQVQKKLVETNELLEQRVNQRTRSLQEANKEITSLLESEREARLQASRINQQLETQNHIGQILSAELDLHKLIQDITDAFTRISGAEFGAFFYNTIDDKGEPLVLYALSGAPMEAFSKFPHPSPTQIFAPTFNGEGIIRSDDITQDARYGHNLPFKGIPEGHLPVRSYLAVPVISRSGKILGGAFFGHSQAGVFTQPIEDTIKTIAGQASIAIDNSFLYETSQVDRRALAHLNKELGQANQDLIRINNDLDNFVYTASHDLKAPIANLEGFAILLSDRLRGRLDEKEMRLVEMIKAMTNRLKATIADLADISRVQKGQEQIPEPLSFEQMMEDTLADLRPIIEQSKAMINVDWQEEEIQYSRKHLRSILSNLIGNALKYRSSERQLEIHVRTYRAGENVVLSVADNGLGIPAHQLPKLFSMFKRFHSHVEGTGIGLYITKRTIENNGGKIEVESREGVGSTFYVYFKQ